MEADPSKKKKTEMEEDPSKKKTMEADPSKKKKTEMEEDPSKKKKTEMEEDPTKKKKTEMEEDATKTKAEDAAEDHGDTSKAESNDEEGLLSPTMPSTKATYGTSVRTTKPQQVPAARATYQATTHPPLVSRRASVENKRAHFDAVDYYHGKSSSDDSPPPRKKHCLNRDYTDSETTDQDYPTSEGSDSLTSD